MEPAAAASSTTYTAFERECYGLLQSCFEKHVDGRVPQQTALLMMELLELRAFAQRMPAATEPVDPKTLNDEIKKELLEFSEKFMAFDEKALVYTCRTTMPCTDVDM